MTSTVLHQFSPSTPAWLFPTYFHEPSPMYFYFILLQTPCLISLCTLFRYETPPFIRSLAQLLIHLSLFQPKFLRSNFLQKMAAKRLLDESKGDPDLPDGKRIRATPSIATFVPNSLPNMFITTASCWVFLFCCWLMFYITHPQFCYYIFGKDYYLSFKHI